jgi:Tol biopolymer transport system component
LLVGFAGTIQAQYFIYGQDPASQKWRQIRTEYFRLIYPDKLEDKAQELAHFLEAIREPMSASLKSNPKPIPVVLRNQTMLSNGFVMWAPKRIEMVTAIPYDNQAIDWMRYLTVHEYRHVVQVEAANTSTTGFLSRIFGQHITGSVVGLHLPLWFLEGDAVLAETSFTRSGRGRLPEFTMPLAAQVLEQGRHSYDKAIFGSYRDMVPNHYILGYHLVAAAQWRYGFEPFQKATRQVGATPFLPGSFSRGIKRSTGKNLLQLYQSAMSELEDEWKSQLGQATITDFQIIPAGKNFDYVSYVNPQYIDDDTFIAFRTTPADIPRLVKIGRDGSEKVVFTPGFGYLGTMSYASGKTAWAEITRDPRWDYRVWTNIRVLDIESGNSKLITRKGRLQAPRLSPDGSKVAAVEVDEINNWALLIFDVDSSFELFRFSDPEIDFLLEPAWSGDGQSIYAIGFTQEKGKSLISIKLAEPKSKKLLDAGFADIFNPVVHNKHVYFTGTFSGKNEIYALDIENQQLHSVVTGRFGVSVPSPSGDGSKMLFSDLTSRGQRIGEAETSQKQKITLPEVENLSLLLFEPAAREQTLLLDTLSLPNTRFDSREFRKFPNTFHFHSWIPLSLDVDGMAANPGITFFSQDLLGTTLIAAGYDYNQPSKGHSGFVDLSLRAWYPVIDLRFDAGAEDRFYRTQQDSIVKLRTGYRKISGGVGLPLSFNHHSLIYGLNPRISTSQEVYWFDFNQERRNRGLRSMSYTFSTYAYRRMAFRDLNPRLGISLAAGFSHTPFRNEKSFTDLNAGDISYGAAIFFLPGIAKHHSLRFYAGMQNRTIREAYFSDRIRFARGYESQANDRLRTYSASYSLPLGYPDIAKGSIIYVKRIKTNLFADISEVSYRNNKQFYSSFGIDMLFDVHLLRMPMPFEFGVRSMYVEELKTLVYELLWGVDFYAVGHLLKTNHAPLRPYF